MVKSSIANNAAAVLV